VCVLAAGVTFSYSALPHDGYRYDGEDMRFGETLDELQDKQNDLRDPLLNDLGGRKMSRLHLAAVLSWQKGVLTAGKRLGWSLAPRPPLSVENEGIVYTPSAPDPAYGWRAVGLAIWCLAGWFLYGLARSWGAWRSTAALGVGLALTAPAVLFHANCLSDHLAAAVVIVLGLHLQIRRSTEGQLFSTTGLLEGLVIVGAAFYTRWTSLFLLGPLVLLRLLDGETPLRRRAAHCTALATGAVLLVLPEFPRITAASTSNITNMFSNYPPEPGLGLLSARHLLANLRPSSLAAFLEPAGQPAFVLGIALGAFVLWRSPPQGGRTPLVVLGATVVSIVGICFIHIHPGSRWLLPLALWSALPLALGFQALLTLEERWTWPGRWAAALLLAGTLYGSITGLTDLKDGWFADAPPAYEAARDRLPVVQMKDLQKTLKAWGGGSPINLIASPRQEGTLAPQRTQPGDPVVLYNPPVIPWSRAFDERPTVFFARANDYSWSTSFQRDYLAQSTSCFGLAPIFVAGEYVALSSKPFSEDSR